MTLAHPEQPAAVGQIWADLDPRMIGRTFRIDSISQTHAICTVLTPTPRTFRKGHTVSIKLRRLRPTSTGYRFISGPQEDGL